MIIISINGVFSEAMGWDSVEVLIPVYGDDV